MDSPKPLLSICIPTYNRASILDQIISSIVTQEEFNQGLVELVISDNASTDNTEEVVKKYLTLYKNIFYYKNIKNIEDSNFPTVIDKANGVFRKLCNDTCFFADGTISFLLKLIEKNINEKPVLFFLNLLYEKRKESVYKTYDLNSFLKTVSYWTTWIGGFGIWEDDYNKIEKFAGCEKRIWQVKNLLEMIESKKETIIYNYRIFKITPRPSYPGELDFYNFFGFYYSVFYKNYIDLLEIYLERNILSKKIFKSLKHDIPLDFFLKHRFGYLLVQSKRKDFSRLFLQYFRDDEYYKEIFIYLTLFSFKQFIIFIKSSIIFLKKNGFIKFSNKVLIFLFRTISGLIYKSEYQENVNFSKYIPKAKAIAFYLPQFHVIPENNKWWGNGFVEWKNTSKAHPRCKGHYQPREPHGDIGYYDLSNAEAIRQQAWLAKQHGIFGFCFYFYWFSGKYLLEKPLNLLLENQDIDMNFCLCWANENWTRTWDGGNKQILIEQKYTENDKKQFINDIKKYVDDKRYIRINGLPLLLIYNPASIPNVKDVFETWRKYAEEIGIGKILILICRSFNQTAEQNNIADIVDGEIEFPPHNMTIYNPLTIRSERNSIVYDYNKEVNRIIKRIISKKKSNVPNRIPLYRTCTMGWDNSARRKSGWTAYNKFSLKKFYNWANVITKEAANTNNKKESIIFINAWNEWGEGAYLEPDKKYGYANINTFSRAICDIPFRKNIL
jgi:glycosyltransferase involved in cell wall biosynthesis